MERLKNRSTDIFFLENVLGLIDFLNKPPEQGNTLIRLSHFSISPFSMA